MASATRNKKRKWLPRPLVLPADEVTWRPSGDWPDEVQEYLIAYARTGSRTGACQLIGRATDWAYRLEQQYGDALTEQENAAYMSIMERVHGVAFTQALEDPDMPGTTTRIFLLKGAYPERYAERRELKHSGNIALDWVSMMREGMEEPEERP